MIKKITLSTLLLCGSALVMAEDVTPMQADAVDSAATKMESMQIRAVAADKPAVPANVPSTTESVTAKQIAESVNSVSSASALLYLPSVHVRERFIGDVNGGLAIRGYGVNSSAETIVYADGLLLSNFLNNSCCPGPRWSMVPQSSIDRVDIMYGPFSALYPGNSVGGVVLMTTHMPDKFEAHAALDTFTENFKLYGTDKNFTGVHGAAMVGNKVGDFSFWLSADHLDNHSHPTDFTPATAKSGAAPLASLVTSVTGAQYDSTIANAPRTTTAAISIDHTVKDDVTLKLGYDFTPTVSATYTLNLWQNTSDKLIDSYLRDAAGNTIYGSGPAGQYQYLKASDGKYYTVQAPSVSHTESLYYMQGLEVKSHTGGTWDWSLNASYFNQKKDVNRASSGYSSATPAGNYGATPSTASNAGTIAIGNGTGWYNVDLRGEWRPSGDLKSEHQVSFGAHTDTYTTKTDSYTLVSGTNWQTSSVGALSTNARGETSTDAIYVQDAWQISPSLKLVFGGREEKWVASNGSNYSASNPAGLKNVQYQDKTVYAFSPKASLSFQASDDWGLRGSYGRGVRFPTVNELFKSSAITVVGGGTVNYTLLPDPYNIQLNNNTNLKPETADSWELSAEHLLQNGTWRTSLFGEEKQDALISQNDLATLPGYSINNIQNIDKVRTYGIETALQTSDMIINKLDVSGSIAYIHSRIVSDTADPRYVGSELPYVPVWRASMLGVYHASDKLSYSLGWRYSGRQHSGTFNPATQQYPDPNPGVYGGRSNFSVFDAKVMYKFAQQWSASVGVDNITNEKYYTLYPYSQRTFFAGAKFNY
ncbi:MAG: TonB-dependent receptor [Betaproteobacteria bacterium]